MLIKQLLNKPLKRKLLVSFSITLVTLIAVIGVAGGFYAGIQALSRPPAIPTHVETLRQLGIGSSNTTGNEGSLPDDADNPPEVIAVMERKPLFYTFLLFALDKGNNADVIVVGALDTVEQRVYGISIPRDTLVDVPRRRRKPVAAYSVGRGGGQGHSGGVAMMKSDVQTLFGFVPDFYVSIDYQAFIQAVDLVGGVEVHVPFHMRYDDPIQRLHINITPGTQVLNGQRALHFARFRMANPGFRAITDYQRIKNQQIIIRALFNEILTPSTIARVPEFIGIYREHVNTNVTYREMLWFANQLSDLRGATLSTYTLPTRGTSGAPGWYELPDRDAILELVNRTVNPFMQEITAEMVRIAK